MPNLLLPVEERTLTPDQIARLDRRRRRGQFLLVVGAQCLLIAILVLLWAGQDATYSPGWHRPMVYWDLLLFGGAVVCVTRGILLRRGVPEFFSY